MADMEIRSRAAALTSSDRPQEPPIASATWLVPPTASFSSRPASSVEERRSPSMHSAHSAAPEGTRASRRFPSARRQESI